MDKNPAQEPIQIEIQSPKWWQKPSVRITILLFILIALIGFYFFKKHQLQTQTNSQTNQTTTFDKYLDILTNKLKPNSEPVSTVAPSPTPTPTPTPTPKPLPHGTQVYNFSHGKNVLGPKPYQVTLKPIDPKLNSSQTFSVVIKHNQPVTEAKIILVTDNQTQTIPLKLKTKTSTQETWTASYKITDSYNYKYQIKMIFSDGQQTYQGALTFR